MCRCASGATRELDSTWAEVLNTTWGPADRIGGSMVAGAMAELSVGDNTR